MPDQLNVVSGFSVRVLSANGDFTEDATVTLTERLDVLIAAAMVPVLSWGISSDVGLTRIPTFKRGLRRRLTPLRRHSNDFCSKMHIRVKTDLMA